MRLELVDIPEHGPPVVKLSPSVEGGKFIVNMGGSPDFVGDELLLAGVSVDDARAIEGGDRETLERYAMPLEGNLGRYAVYQGLTFADVTDSRTYKFVSEFDEFQEFAPLPREFTVLPHERVSPWARTTIQEHYATLDQGSDAEVGLVPDAPTAPADGRTDCFPPPTRIQRWVVPRMVRRF